MCNRGVFVGPTRFGWEKGDAAIGRRCTPLFSRFDPRHWTLKKVEVQSLNL